MPERRSIVRKNREELAAKMVHAVFDFMYETEFTGIMPATYRLIQAHSPSMPENQIQEFTLRLLMPGDISEKQKRVYDSFLAILDEIKNEREIVFADEATLLVWNNTWHRDRLDFDIFEEITVKVLPDMDLPFHPEKTYVQKYKKGIKKISAPKIVKFLFDSMSYFPFDSLTKCDECGKYFFDERGYKRRFCSKKCNDHHAVKKSRAKAKKGGGGK